MKKSPMILYVEDDPSSVLVVKTIAQRVMGIQTLFVFQDSGKFVEKLSDLDLTPDLVLLDIHMKPYNGFEVLQIMRDDDRFRNTKVVAVTASVMEEEVDRLKQSGFDGVISKPVNVNVFPGLIERILGGESVWSVC